jgi:hypothetical protein
MTASPVLRRPSLVALDYRLELAQLDDLVTTAALAFAAATAAGQETAAAASFDRYREYAGRYDSLLAQLVADGYAV